MEGYVAVFSNASLLLDVSKHSKVSCCDHDNDAYDRDGGQFRTQILSKVDVLFLIDFFYLLFLNRSFLLEQFLKTSSLAFFWSTALFFSVQVDCCFL